MPWTTVDGGSPVVNSAHTSAVITLGAALDPDSYQVTGDADGTSTGAALFVVS
jgi:hypothetical protein